LDRWQFWIDPRGTATDIVVRSPNGAFVTTELPSEDPAHHADAATEGIRRLGGDGDVLIANVEMGTTFATNALPECKGSSADRRGVRRSSDCPQACPSASVRVGDQAARTALRGRGGNPRPAHRAGSGRTGQRRGGEMLTPGGWGTPD